MTTSSKAPPKQIKTLSNGLRVETLILFFIVSVTLLGDSSLYVLLPIHAESIGVPVGMVGILLSINRFVRLFTNYAVSVLHVYFSSRIMIAASILFAALTTLIYGLPAGLIILFCARLMWGFCWSVLRFEAYESIAAHTDEAYIGRASGLYHSITRIGSLVSLLIGGVLIERSGFRSTFYWFALLTGIIGIILYQIWNHYRKKNQHIQLSKGKVGKKAPSNRDEVQHSVSAKTVGKTQTSRFFCYTFTLVNGWIGAGLLVTTVGYIMMLKFGQSLTLGGITIGISMAASYITSTNWFYSVFLSVVFGRLSDKFGRVKVLTAFCSLLIISLILIAYSANLPLFALAATLGFAATIALNATLTALTVDLHSQSDDRYVISHQTTFNDLGSALGALFGYTLVVFLGYRTTYLFTLIILAIMLVLYVSVNWRTNRASHRQSA